MSPGVAECKISNRRTADIVLTGLEAAVQSLNDVIQAVKKYETEEQIHVVAHAIGTVMGTDMHDLFMSLLMQHPYLDRHGLLTPPQKGSING